MSTTDRIEKDIIGELKINGNCLHGIHTQQAVDNFNLANHPALEELVKNDGIRSISNSENI